MIGAIRAASGIQPNQGPTDQDISNALDGFVGQFDYWFDRVMGNAVKNYRKLVIARINPFVRGVEYQGFDAQRVGRELVRDYANRNFVTAGGWAIEKMAIALGSKNAKAAAPGIDLLRVDPATGAQHLYVIKSGPVTRNSDILAALKRHANAARKLLMQGGSKVEVRANYAVAAGAIKSTFEDNIFRPSSAAFWSEVTELPEDKAIHLVHEISKVAAYIIRRGAQPHIDAMQLLVVEYITDPTDGVGVDWAFIFKRTMEEKKLWAADDLERHKTAWAKLIASGYKP